MRWSFRTVSEPFVAPYDSSWGGAVITDFVLMLID